MMEGAVLCVKIYWFVEEVMVILLLVVTIW